MGEVILTFVLNFTLNYIRVKQIYFLNSGDAVRGTINSGFISVMWLGGSLLGLKGLSELNYPVVAAYIMANMLSAYIAIVRNRTKDGE